MFDLDAYCLRIGYSGERTPTLATLRALVARHTAAIPFETLASLLCKPVALDLPSLHGKLVTERRGGYCFEHNTLLAHALRALGLQVTALAARVVMEPPLAGGVAPRTHMVLLVAIDDSRYLCDVGFGGLTPTAPIEFVPDVEQTTSHEPYRVRTAMGEHALQVRVAGIWRDLYTFDLQEQLPIDIELLNFYVSMHPESSFRGQLRAARAATGKRFALRNRRFTVYYPDGRRDERDLATVAELRATLREAFGVDVARDAELDAALERLLA